MEGGALKVLDAHLYRRGQYISTLARWLSVALGLLSLAFVWDHPRTRPQAAVLVVAVYGAFTLAAFVGQRMGHRGRRLKIAQDLADALGVGFGAAVTGGLESPMWLLLYPHVVGVSVRAGLAYALAIALLDAAIVSVLTVMTPQQPLGALHALTLLFCGFLGGTTSAYLGAVQRSLRDREQDVKAQAERLAAINEIANAVNLSLTVEDITGAVAREARRLLPFDCLSLGLLEEDGAQVEVVSPGAGLVRQRSPFPRAAVSWAFRRPLAWCEGDPEPVPEHVPALLPARSLRAVATVPLLSKGRVIGSLNVGRLASSAFTAPELAALEPVARHIAAALDNARLLEAVRNHAREFESLLEISRRIGERMDLRELLPMVTRSVNRVMGTEHCLIFLREGDRLRVVAREGVEPEVVDAFVDLRVGDSLSGWVIQQGRMLAVEDMRQDPRLMFRNLVEAYAYRSYLGVPLRRGSEIIGTLEVVTKHAGRRFGQEEQALMAAFADQAAVAIDNARLLDQTRQHLERVVETNRQLEELDRLRREYLRNVSHEFRTPLTVIRGYAEFLEGSKADARTVADVMSVIVESCDRVIDLVDTLIEVSRVEQADAGRTLHLQQLDLRELAESSLEPLRSAAERKSVRLDLDFPRERALVLQGDRGLLGHLVRKLVDNAVKYSPAGARVLVRGEGNGDDLTLEVEDFGIGIPQEHVTRIFEKFYMVDGGITRRAGGSGVGLYLVREIVRLHHGRVDVESRPGQGSVFRIRLPRQAVGEAARA
jgi:signal transduction histidine kinase